MAFRRIALLVLAAVIATALGAALSPADARQGGNARLLHTEPSEFSPVVVFEEYGERCMNFVAIERRGRQSCYRLDDPDRLVFEYTRMMASALLAKPEPRSILIIGLGGASLPIALHNTLPDAVIDTVDIDPAVVRVARKYFGYQTGPRQRVFIEDGRKYIESARREGRTYDIIMLDAFDTDYIPAHLLTVEFLQEVRLALAPGGLVVANSFTRSEIYHQESATYAEVFDKFYELRARLDGNRVIIASNRPLPGKQELRRNARDLAPALKPLGIDANAARKRFKILKPSKIKGEPLRDATVLHQSTVESD